MTATIYNNVRAVGALPAAVYTASTNGATVDRRGANLENYRAIGVAVNVGVVTDGTHAISIQDSDNGTDWAAAAAADVVGGPVSVTSSAGGSATYQLEYKGNKRYVRVVTAVSGSPATGGRYSAVLLLGSPRRAPLVR